MSEIEAEGWVNVKKRLPEPAFGKTVCYFDLLCYWRSYKVICPIDLVFWYAGNFYELSGERVPFDDGDWVIFCWRPRSLPISSCLEDK